ncbi:MAG TPA: M14 family zinc carboxypeptidase [Solirubrobacter sp.]
MRSRASALMLAPLVALALAPAAAHAADTLSPYKAQVSAAQAADLKTQGFDVQEANVSTDDGPLQDVELIASDSQVKDLAADGIDLAPLPVDKPVAKSAALGNSPNPFFNVYRSYMEPGGIADEMKALAAANPDVMKLEQYGTSTLGKPLYTIKMTANARNVADGARPAILFSAVNHAREWIAAEMGRRLPIWFAEHKNDPEIARLISDRELWFVPIQNPDGYDFTFTCGLGAAQVPCDYRVRTADDNRFWRKTLRDNDANGIYGNSQDGVDPNRNYPSKRGIDEEGASNSFSSETYRGPYALSEPEDLGIDRLQRRIGFEANINYHSAGQLLLTPVSYTTDYYPPDSTLFDAITGTDGDEAVFPYRSQHSSDLYESNGDTIDNAYMNYGIIGWTPEMDTCATLGEPAGCNQFASPDNESKVAAVFQKNLAFALNVAGSIKNLGRPKNFDNDPSHYQVKPTQDIQPNRFDVSYGGSQIVEATIRKELGDADITVNVVGQNTSLTIPMTPSPAGERYGEVKGYYFERRQATIPATIGTRAIQAGDVVDVVVKAGGLQREFRYRVEALPDPVVAGQPVKKRVLVVAAEDYTGVSPNVKPGYATAPRYLAQHVAALQAAGYEVETFNIDAPPQNGGQVYATDTPIKYPTYLGVMSHFDAVNYYTGDDFIPQDTTETNPRRIATATTQTGSQEMAPWAHKVMLELREYANNGGKLLVDGRNVHQTFTASGSSLTATGPYTWTPDKLYGFFYPPNNAGDDDLPGTAWQRSRGISNDTWQNYLGVVGRQSGVGVTLQTTANSGNPNIAGYPVAPATGGLFAGMAPIALDEGSTDDPNQNADGTPFPQPRIPLRLRNWGPTNEPLRAETVQADFATPVTYTTSGGSIISTRDAVTFSFGLEQANEASRNELVKRAMSYLLPATPDTTPPTIVGFKYPSNLSNATINDPVEIELTAYDERGDMDYVDLKGPDGALVQRTEVYPFQFRYTPPASAIGSVVKLTAEAVDKAGNKSSRDLLLNVLDSNSRPLTPVAVNPPSLVGTPTVGSQLSCINGGFINAPKTLTYAWLRSGVAIAGATSPTYTLATADLGRTIACRITATNDAGSGDATSESLTVINPTATPGPGAAAAPTTTVAAAPVVVTKAGLAFAAACKLSATRKAVTCAVSSNSTAKFTGSIRLAGHKSAAASKTGKKKVTFTVRTTKALKKGTKVVLKLKSGKTSKTLTVTAS